MGTLSIFGEAHFSKTSLAHIEAYIRKHRPDYLLHELLYEDVALDANTIRQRLQKCGVGQPCDPTLNRDIYELGLELDIKLVGVDMEKAPGRTMAEQFAHREAHMLSVIEKYRPKGNVIVVVGDIHLRSRGNAMVPPSVLYTELKPVADVFDRTGKALREME